MIFNFLEGIAPLIILLWSQHYLLNSRLGFLVNISNLSLIAVIIWIKSQAYRSPRFKFFLRNPGKFSCLSKTTKSNDQWRTFYSREYSEVKFYSREYSEVLLYMNVHTIDTGLLNKTTSDIIYDKWIAGAGGLVSMTSTSS